VGNPNTTYFYEEHPVMGSVSPDTQDQSRWVAVGSVLWEHRRALFRLGAIALALSTLLAFLIPKEYESKVKLMPPEHGGGSGIAMLAALSGNSSMGLGALAASMLGGWNTGDLFVDLLKSRSVQEGLVDHFQLQKVYRARYRQDALKVLKRRTDVTEDRKSGIITIVTTDRDRQRARDMAQAYVDGLNSLVAQVSTSSAGRERIFIEQRLASAKPDLDAAERNFSQFASKNSTLDLKEQTKAMVEAGSTLQAQLIVTQAELQSLQQIYGDENVRVRATRARAAALQQQLSKFSGTEDSLTTPGLQQGELYPSMRKLPLLGVQWIDLYRQTRIKETVYELLTQQYELARIEEAKSIPTVRVIDPPNWPEKKSFPPRLIVMLATTMLSVAVAGAWIYGNHRWKQVNASDPRKVLLQKVRGDTLARVRVLLFRNRSAA
jgi:capsule polysaccharide export protein KpsE/RkpR